MDLKSKLSKEMLSAIEKNYYNESYSSAILDAMYLLTETIREKTGLEGDGSSLIGQAFGGDNPKIKLNNLQTESERNEQKGIQEILRGFYTAIRNPRSHDKYTDSSLTAEVIILFIDYLLGLIDKSKLSFEEGEFLLRVFDDHFVNSEEYSNLLIDEIPERQKVNIAISVILKRQEGDSYKLATFLKCLIKRLEDEEIDRLYNIISEELKHTEEGIDIRTILQCCPAELWTKINKAIRLRIENIILSDIKKGNYNVEDDKIYGGALGTWMTPKHIFQFNGAYSWSNIITKKLDSHNKTEMEYVLKFHWENLVVLNDVKLNYHLSTYLKKALKEKNSAIIEKIRTTIQYDENHLWWKELLDEITEYTDIVYDSDFANLF